MPQDLSDTISMKVTGWLEKAFPDRSCPKCGNSKFYILDPPPQPLASGPLTFDEWPITKIACTRCGFVEEHLTGILKKSIEKGETFSVNKGKEHE